MEGLIKKQEFLKLAAVKEPNCVSIYIPAERAGEASYQKQGRILIKNSIQLVNKKLTEAGVPDQQISAMLEKLNILRDNDHIWRDHSNGMAIFINQESMYQYRLPLPFKEELYVEDRFYLLPILPFFNDDGTFYLMTLSQQNVHLFECSRYFITEIDITDLVPSRLEESVGSNYRQKSLQHRSGQAGHGRAMYHGQGAGKDDSEIETKKFFRDVDRGILNLLGSDNDPLVLACVEEHHPVYKEISSYPNIYDDFLSGNSDQEDPLLLHEKAWELVKDHFRKKRESLREQFQNLSTDDKTNTDLE